jgi:biofilm PGA synthesis N-glycosyltransferase PgaC
MSVAQGDIVVFTDARQKIERGAIRLLMENFADPEVGAVSGELMLGDPANGETDRGVGLYWRIEKRVRELESSAGSVVGATGAIYAVRRELVAKVPADTILDDVFIPMNVAKQGFRVLFDERAKAWDAPDLGSQREFRRKVRTLSGNYQLLQLAPWLLRGENPLRRSLCADRGSGNDSVSAGAVLPRRFLGASRILRTELIGTDPVETRSSLKTQ